MITISVQPARWVIAASNTITATAVGLLLGVAGTVAGFAGAVIGGLAIGNTADLAT